MFYKQQQKTILVFLLTKYHSNSYSTFFSFFFIIICDMYQQFLSKNGIQVNCTPYLFINYCDIIYLINHIVLM